MMLTFSRATQKYQKDLIGELGECEQGRRFLLLRSLSRTAHLEALAATAGINIDGIPKRALFETLFKSKVTKPQIISVIKSLFKAERKQRSAQEPALVSELYKMKEFNWGGLHQNSLEKTIVNNYVKKVRSYDVLNAHVENELLDSMRGYVRCSWYNHWTSIMIEDIFKSHSKVLPAVGLVKKIDFFVRGVPFDLKVTYLPEGYVKEQRQVAELRPELTLLKQAARKRNIAIDTTLSAAALLEHLWTVITDQPDKEARALTAELQSFRLSLVKEIEKDPTPLITWLYENQGERRFDASNRLFLVLVNERNFFQSWQLKRNRAVLEKSVASYLDGAAKGKQIKFKWEGATYSTLADVIVVRHKV